MEIFAIRSEDNKVPNHIVGSNGVRNARNERPPLHDFSDLHMTDYLYGNDAFPAGNIVSPILNQQIAGISDVIGTVTDNISVDGTTILSSLSSWTLEYGEGEEPETWMNIVTSSTSMFNGLLASWHTSSLSSGNYTLRLRATDGEHENIETTSIVIQNIKGDINADGDLDLADAILALKVMAGANIAGQDITVGADVNGDGKIGLQEIIYILQKVSGVRD